MIKLTINPGKKKLTIPAGKLLLDVLHENGMMIATPCGGKGNCGKCKILISPQDANLNTNEKKWLTEEEIKKGFRLACQTTLTRSSTITIPSYTLMNEDYSIFQGKITSHLLNDDFKPVQMIKKIYLQLDSPTLQDQRSDWTRINNELEKIFKDSSQSLQIPIAILNKIPGLLRDNHFRITLVLFKTKTSFSDNSFIIS